METYAYRSADAFVVRGTHHPQFLREQGCSKDVHVVPDGVDLDAFRLVDGDGLREQLGLTDAFTIGVQGHFTWYPRLGGGLGWELLHAIALRPDLPLHAVLIGDGPGIDELRRLARELGISDRLHVIGRVPYRSLAAYLAICDVCLLTQTNDPASWVRTTGKLPVYLAAGRYLLATRVGTAVDVLPDEMLLDYHGSWDLSYPARASPTRSPASSGIRRVSRRAGPCGSSPRSSTTAPSPPRLPTSYAAWPVRGPRCAASSRPRAGWGSVRMRSSWRSDTAGPTRSVRSSWRPARSRWRASRSWTRARAPTSRWSSQDRPSSTTARSTTSRLSATSWNSSVTSSAPRATPRWSCTRSSSGVSSVRASGSTACSRSRCGTTTATACTSRAMRSASSRCTGWATAVGSSPPSEATPLAAAFGLRPRPDAIREFLRFGSPVTDVAYERVAELEPGTVLTWHDHTVRVRPFAARSANGLTPVEAARSSIARQLRSDRPMALFLSGGFDSALLAAVAAETGAPVSALTLSTHDNFDDVRLAAETARHYGLPHEVVSVDEAGLARSADEFLGALDQPTVDGFNTFLVARAAVDRGFPVALSGLGGDETLGGYGYSQRLRQVQRARRVWDRLPAVVRPSAVAALAPWLGQPAPRLESILDARSPAATWAAWRRLFDDDEIRGLTGAVAGPSPRLLTDADDSDHAQLRHLDFAVYLRATLLRDTDVFSMANSIEVRVPLLDPTFVLATEHAEPTKLDLAQLMGDDLLTTRARAHKLAFALPWQRWLPLLQPDEVLTTGGPFAEMVDVAYARRLLADDARSGPMSGLRRWALLVLAHWLAREPAARQPMPRPASRAA